MASELGAWRDFIATVGVTGFLLIILAIIAYLIVNSKTKEFNEMTNAQEVLRKTFQSQQTEIAALRTEINTLKQERETARAAREAERDQEQADRQKEREAEREARAKLAQDFQEKLDAQAEEIWALRYGKKADDERHAAAMAQANATITLLTEERDAAIQARDAAISARDAAIQARDEALRQNRAKDGVIDEKNATIERLTGRIDELEDKIKLLERQMKVLEHPSVEPPASDTPAPAEKASD